MLTTQQKTLRKFWYATMPVSHLTEGPKPFRLMNEDIVLFLDADGNPAALRDRCCHRTAKLSKGWMDDGDLVCGYHGWTYDRDRQGGADSAIRTGARPCRGSASIRSTARRAMAMYGWRWMSRCCRCSISRRTARPASAASSSSMTNGRPRRCG